MLSSPWRHFVLLLGLAIMGFYLLEVLSLAQTTSSSGSVLLNAARELPAILYRVLPAVAGLAVATMPIDGRSTRIALMLVVTVIAAMLLLDSVATPVLAAPSTRGNVIESQGYARGAAFALSHAREVGETLRVYPVNHARVVASESLGGLALLIMPGILIGLVLGVSAWMRDRVTFRTLRDERVARWVIAWLLVPGAWAFIGNWSLGYQYRILFRGQPIWLILVPYLPALLLATIGWRRSQRNTAAPLSGGVIPVSGAR